MSWTRHTPWLEFHAILIWRSIISLFAEINNRNCQAGYIYHKQVVHTSLTVLLQTKQSTSWFVSSVGRALQRYRRGHGFNSGANLQFFQALHFHYSLSSFHNIWWSLSSKILHKFKVEFSKNAFYHNKQHKLFKVHVNEEKLFISVKNFKIKLSHLKLSFIKCNLPWHVTATFMQSKRWIEKGVETKIRCYTNIKSFGCCLNTVGVTSAIFWTNSFYFTWLRESPNQTNNFFNTDWR